MKAVAFILKNIISALCYPLGLSLFLLFSGMLLWRRRNKNKIGFLVVLAGVMCLLLMSLPIISFILARSLEAVAGDYANPSVLAQRGVRYIVVLSGSPVLTDLTSADRWQDTIFRIMEGVRIWRGIPNGILVLSGGSYPGRVSNAEAMAELPTELGVPRASLILETRAWDTLDEVHLFAHIVGKGPFALVTSAIHMPRSMRLFEDFGSQPIPCPCRFTTRDWPPFYRLFIPSVQDLDMSTLAIHEYLGSLWFTIQKAILGPKTQFQQVR